MTVNGVQLHCEQTGKGNHPVLLIPGALGKEHVLFHHVEKCKHFILGDLLRAQPTNENISREGVMLTPCKSNLT